MTLRLRLAILLLGSAAGPGLAQTPAASAEGVQDDVVVVAPDGTPTELLGAMLETTGDRQIVRFEQSACPKVIELPPALARGILRAIRANAEAAGLTMLDEGCTPDAIAMFVEDSRALVAAMRGRDPLTFAQLPADKLAELAEGQQAVRSWHVVVRAGMYGRKESVAEHLVPLTAVKMRSLGVAKSVSKKMVAGYAVIDRARIIGRTVQQIADVATLHLLLDLNAEAAARAGTLSVLAAFGDSADAKAAPGALTTLDRGMLAGLGRQRTTPRRSTSAPACCGR